VDPGHGGNDPGALGFYPDKDEADINLEIAQRLADELKSQGASVLMVTPGSTMASRLESARAFNPQVLVSVHNNTNWNPEAKGSEVCSADFGKCFRCARYCQPRRKVRALLHDPGVPICLCADRNRLYFERIRIQQTD